MKPAIEQEHLELVFERAKSLAGREYGDYVTSGYIALTKAQQGYVVGRGASFRTYAFRRITGAIMDQLRVERGTRRKFKPTFEPLHESITADRRIGA